MISSEVISSVMRSVRTKAPLSKPESFYAKVSLNNAVWEEIFSIFWGKKNRPGCLVLHLATCSQPVPAPARRLERGSNEGAKWNFAFWMTSTEGRINYIQALGLGKRCEGIKKQENRRIVRSRKVQRTTVHLRAGFGKQATHSGAGCK